MIGQTTPLGRLRAHGRECRKITASPVLVGEKLNATARNDDLVYAKEVREE